MNKFKNTTPASGTCQGAGGKDCLRLPVKFESNAEILARHSVRRGPMFKVPSEWQPVEIRNERTGEAKVVKIRVSGIGSQYVTDPVKELVGVCSVILCHDKLWLERMWSLAPRPCTNNSGGRPTEDSYAFFWRTPVAEICAKTAAYAIPWMKYSYLDIQYELDMPDPLSMLQGQYTGSWIYSLGPNADFDMGDVMIPSDNTLTLNFIFDVDHELKVEIPPGGNRVELIPEGGWQTWLQTGRTPTDLSRNQTFIISASGPFSMRLMNCSVPVWRNCAIANERNHVVPLTVAVSLPNEFADLAGRPVIRTVLENDKYTKFKSGTYVERRPAILHFSVDPYYVSQMVLRHTGTTYTGTVTIVWDSEV